MLKYVFYRYKYGNIHPYKFFIMFFVLDVGFCSHKYVKINSHFCSWMCNLSTNASLKDENTKFNPEILKSTTNISNS